MSDVNKTNLRFNMRSCRVCLDSNCENVVTLEEQNGWLQLFKYCFDLSLTSQDEPRVLCQQCADNVKNYSMFKKQCHRSDKIWKSLGNTSSTEENKHNVDDKLLFNEQSPKLYTCDNSNNDIKPFDSEFDIYNDNSIDEIVHETYGNGNPFESKINDIVKEETVHKTCIPEINEKEQSIQSIGNKIKDVYKCARCQKSYASHLSGRHKKLCKAKKELSTISRKLPQNRSATKVSLQDSHEITKTCQIKKQTDSALYYCGICKFNSDKIEDVKKHLKEHWTSEDLRCKLCQFVGKDEAATAAHRYVHSTVINSSFWCHICDKKTRSLLSLQFHYRKIHLNKSGGLCSQPHCNKVYNSWRLWKRHEKLHNHPGYVCDICGQKYRHRHLIIEHLINHSNPPSHICDVCGKTFLRLRNLRVHIENVHTQPDPIKCTHCNRMFKNQHYLRVHQRREAMDKVWKCEFCPMEYAMQSALNVHLRSHSEERPYCCHICGSRYKGKGQLIIHMRNHTGSRPFKCVQCGKAFTSSAQLKTHNIIHTGILPYKCLHCEKSFRCKKRMMKHCAFNHKVPEKK